VKSNAITALAGDSLESPMQGTVVKIVKSNGDRVEVGDLIVVLEAMKMEQPLISHKAGTIAKLQVNVGQTVASGATLCLIED
jgi:acetyl-CoA/propionyl-CoA carboxylase biotin carboxyl carrier protein